VIIDSYYINTNVQRALNDTGLALDELELIVSRFRTNNVRAGQLRGEVVIYSNGRVAIRQHFNKKILWRQL
jgi:hypothetical protein